jgi:hypothetical protein
MFALSRTTVSKAILAAAACLGAVAAHAVPWTSVGSAGTVDEADNGIAYFLNGEARINPAAPNGSSLDIRYNVVALEGFDPILQSTAWRVRYVDSGAASRVLLRLRQYNIATGVTSTLATFDSDTFPQSANYQTQGICIAPTWNFANGPFFIEATLTRSAAAPVAPGLGVMQLTPGNCLI